MDDLVDRLAARSSDKTISAFADKINRVANLDNRTVLNLLSNIFIAVDNSDLTSKLLTNQL